MAKNAPDGYTILLTTNATLAIAPSLFQNLGYDPRRDFEPIGLIAATPNVIVVHPSFPAHSLSELIKIGKEVGQLRSPMVRRERGHSIISPLSSLRTARG